MPDDVFEWVPGVPAAGHISRGYWHPGAIPGCTKCAPPTPPPPSVQPNPIRTLVWKEDRDTGGMFPDRLEIWDEPDGGFTAVVKDGWNRVHGTLKCDTYDLAHRACYDLLNKSLGLTGDLQEGPY